MNNLITKIHNCKICLPHLKHGVNPVFTAHPKSKIAIIGQAPGSVVHKSGIAWDDKSGERLRQWLNVSTQQFYDEQIFALIPMGFCYPGKGKTGDLPPRKECGPQWHNKLFSHLKHLKLILLVGQYAQGYYLGDKKERTLTETVKNYQTYLPEFLPLPHPSPRNNIWLKKNEWFEKYLIPELQDIVETTLKF